MTAGPTLRDAAQLFLAAGTPVAAICGATAGLAQCGLLDDRDHTSAAAEYLPPPGTPARVTIATSGRSSAATSSPPDRGARSVRRATLRRLGLVSEDTVKAYVAVMHRGDQSAYPALMAAR